MDQEVDTWRNQLPPEPWVPPLRAKSNEAADWIRSRLAAGSAALPSVVVNARKATIGTRPVPILGIADRVAYRALTKFIFGDLPIPDRSPEAYRQFLHGPIDYALSERGAAIGWNFANASLKYVVEADIAAFYQYIDHDLLRHELELHTGRIEAIAFLIELLGEVEGRTFGIPQLLDASDWLSDIYIQSVERDLLRRGLPVWRYNDDFLIGCQTYTEALDAIERLEEASRAVGLTVSSHKTHTPTFSTYLHRTTGRDISEALIAIDRGDVEVIVSDYPDLNDEERVVAAFDTLARLDVDPDDDEWIDIHNLSSEGVRDLRRAVGGLTRARNPGAIERLIDLMILVPSLTPRVCDYMISVYEPERAESIERVLDTLIEHASLGEWQALWLVSVMRHLDLLKNDPRRTEWVRQQRERGRGRLLAAEARLALASAGVGDFDDLDYALRTEPEVLAPWHLLAIKAMAASSGAPLVDRARAVRDSHPLNRILLT